MSDLVRTRRPVKLTLGRDLLRSIRSGHPWVYREALKNHPEAPAGSAADLFAADGKRAVASGYYDPDNPLAFRVCRPDGPGPLDDDWAVERLETAVRLREQVIPTETTGYRLVNGEGDGLPGLVVDRYGDSAVLKLDGPGPTGFWNAGGVAGWLAGRVPVAHVIERSRDRGAESQVLVGDPPQEPEFLERGLRFTADVRHGQKTGFFLDQRENRRQVRELSAGRTVLNLFSYTGGFSIAAGVGGASHVVSVDSAAPAIAVGDRHWTLNGLDPANHESVAADAFDFLEKAAKKKRRWNIVVVDPPSFAPSAKTVERARTAYTKLFAAAAAVTAPGGLLAACSCSSHIGAEDFLAICQTAMTQSRRRGRVLSISGQPADHPWPLACPELRYLKFVLLQTT